MSISATISFTAAAIGLMAALVALGISSAPGWRELRWFAVCAACAALFTVSNAWVTLEIPDDTRSSLARAAVFFGGCHTLAWWMYSAARDHRALTRFERAFVGGGAVLSVLTLVPNLILRDEVFVRVVPITHEVYRDLPPTSLGQLAFAYHSFGLGFLFVRYLLRWWHRERDAGALAIALGAVLVGATHDSFASAGHTSTPYILEEALLVLVLAVGGAQVSRFLTSARALDETARRLEIAQEELVRRERLAALGELAAVVAHEVRNPLAVVFNALAGLRKAPASSPDHDRLLTIVQEEAERLRDMVSDLLDFAKPKAPHFAPADVVELVRSAVDAAREEVHAAADQVEVSAPERLPQVECDDKLLRQAVINLVTNALQAEARASAVHVAIEHGDGGVAIAVTDDGEGVSDDVKERVFTPFFTTRPSGTGLGLAVVQRCAEAHGGAVVVEKPGARGARFTLRIPARAQD